MEATGPAGFGAARVTRPSEALTRGIVPVVFPAIMVYFMMLPQQLGVYLGGLFLPPYRFYLLAAFFYIVFAAGRGKIRFCLPDALILLGCAWVWASSWVITGTLPKAAEQGGAHLVDIALPYFLVRATIQTPLDLRRFLVLIVPAITFTAVFVVQEAITHVRYIEPLASGLTGARGTLPQETRLGFLRGGAGFPHPILAGIFLGGLLPLYAMANLRGWPKIVGLAASLAAVFTLSSSAMLCLASASLALAYEWLMRHVQKLTWKLFLVVLALVYVVVEATSNTGFYGLVLRYASLDAASGGNRLLIWEYGTQNILDNPLFGIGYSDWVRPSWMWQSTFDQFWLITALRFGMPFLACVLLACLMGIYASAKRSIDYEGSDARLHRAVAIALAVFALAINSVALWGAALAWFFVLIAIAVSLGVETAPAPRRKRPTSRTRGGRAVGPDLANRQDPAVTVSPE